MAAQGNSKENLPHCKYQCTICRTESDLKIHYQVQTKAERTSEDQLDQAGAPGCQTFDDTKVHLRRTLLLNNIGTNPRYLIISDR